MDLDNIIYIVATIVIFVVSLLGQNKKKKLQKSVSTQAEDVVYSLNDFEKILERKQEFQNDETTVNITETNEIEEIAEPIVEEKQEEKISEKRRFGHEEDDNNDGFDVKSAIIYSSILERKKFRH